MTQQTIHIWSTGGDGGGAAICDGPVQQVAAEVMRDAANHGHAVEHVSQTSSLDGEVFQSCWTMVVILEGRPTLWRHVFTRPRDPWPRDPAGAGR